MSRQSQEEYKQHFDDPENVKQVIKNSVLLSHNISFRMFSSLFFMQTWAVVSWNFRTSEHHIILLELLKCVLYWRPTEVNSHTFLVQKISLCDSAGFTSTWARQQKMIIFNQSKLHSLNSIYLWVKSMKLEKLSSTREEWENCLLIVIELFKYKRSYSTQPTPHMSWVIQEIPWLPERGTWEVRKRYFYYRWRILTTQFSKLKHFFGWNLVKF